MRTSGYGNFLLCTSVALISVTGNACTVCMGDPEAPMTKGVQAGIAVLLMITACMLLCFAIFFYNLRKNARYSRNKEVTP